MSLENPKLNIADFAVFDNRLQAIEAALGMTNSDNLSDATTELSNGLFIFGNTVSTTNFTKLIVLYKKFTAPKGHPQSTVTIPISQVDSQWSCYPVSATLRIQDWNTNKPAEYSPTVVLTNGSGLDYWKGGANISCRVAHNKEASSTSGPDDNISMYVYVLLMCTNDLAQ